jgi:predicted phosphodiesterase
MKNQITIIGDVHGKYKRYHEIIRETEHHPYSIQIGDFGFKYDTLKNVDPKNHVFIGGNHDNYEVVNDVPNYLGDYGHMVNFNGIDFFYYRGAYSIDRQYRTIGIDWWEEEQVAIDQFIKARELYRDIKPYIMITHDCPQDIVLQMLKPGDRVFENNTSWALQELFNIHQPKMWFFGHWHKSRQIQHGNTKFICLDELETYNLVKDSY